MDVNNDSLFAASTALYVDDVIEECELVAVYEATRRHSPEFQYWQYQRIEKQLQNMNDDECFAEFGFADLSVLAEVLRLPERFVCPNGTVASKIEGLCIVLKRFAYPCRYNDMIYRFGRSVTELSLIASQVIDYIHTTHGHLLRNLTQAWLRPECLEEFAKTIYDKGAALNNCWGFVDGTVRPISRPGENQRIMYNGHKRVHAIKFESIVTSNGLIANLYGPTEGKRHDSGILRMSGLLESMQEHCNSARGHPMCIYGDPAYPLRPHLMVPYQHPNLTEQEADFNGSMSSVRVEVEWIVGDIVNYFKFLDFKKNLKIGLSPVGKMYCVCALLHNARPCLYGNNSAMYFGLEPPTIQEYFQFE